MLGRWLQPYLLQIYYFSNSNTSRYTLLLVVIFTAVAVLLAVILSPIVLAALNKSIMRFNIQAEAKNRLASEHNAVIEQEALVVSQNITNIAQELRNNYLNIFPQQYLDEEIVGYLYNLVTNYRANTLSEAINLYEEEQHRCAWNEASNK